MIALPKNEPLEKSQLMKAVFLVKNGSANQAFEIRETEKPSVGDQDVLIEIEAFGLNYAEVMARLGLYRDAPPLPFIPGYDCVGRVVDVGENADKNWINKRVAAMMRFGSYAEYGVANQDAIVAIGEDLAAGVGAAIGVQYNTAYYSACESVNLFEGDTVLIHAAAGGVGTALVQLAQWKSCRIIGIAGSDEKIEHLKKSGVHLAINRKKENYLEVIEREFGKECVDVSFNAVAGTTFKKDMKLLNAGGRLVLFGASQRSSTGKSKMADMQLLWSMGILFPIFLVGSSKSIIGVNMLRIADAKPQVLKRVMHEVVKLIEQGILAPQSGGEYSVTDIAKAHEWLEKGKTSGKVIVKW